MDNIAEKEIHYPGSGMYKGKIILTKHWSGCFIVNYKEIGPALFNNSFSEKLETLPEALGLFNAKLIELQQP